MSALETKIIQLLDQIRTALGIVIELFITRRYPMAFDWKDACGDDMQPCPVVIVTQEAFAALEAETAPNTVYVQRPDGARGLLLGGTIFATDATE